MCNSLVPLLHATNHIAHGNQLALNLLDTLLFAIEYACIGLAVEEEVMMNYPKQAAHCNQHQVCTHE